MSYLVLVTSDFGQLHIQDRRRHSVFHTTQYSKKKFLAPQSFYTLSACQLSYSHCLTLMRHELNLHSVFWVALWDLSWVCDHLCTGNWRGQVVTCDWYLKSDWHLHVLKFLFLLKCNGHVLREKRPLEIFVLKVKTRTGLLKQVHTISL